jgi:hypothetical protein
MIDSLTRLQNSHMDSSLLLLVLENQHGLMLRKVTYGRGSDSRVGLAGLATRLFELLAACKRLKILYQRENDGPILTRWSDSEGGPSVGTRSFYGSN